MGNGSNGQVSLGTREEGQTEAKNERRQPQEMGKGGFETEGLTGRVDTRTK